MLVDAGELNQVLMNLAMNSRDAMPHGGTLSISVLRIDPSDGTSTASPRARIEVADDGTGMTEDIAAKVFEPFFSTKKGGTGLGLPTTRKIIEAHGGTLAVESETGRGSKFTIRLPAVECG